MKRLLSAFAIATILSGPAMAQEEDGSGDAAQPTCEVSANWRVILTELGDVPGMMMDVNKRDTSGQPDCATKNVKADFTVGGPDQVLWFTALSQDYLVMARSTGPVGSVVIQNLNDKTIILDVVSDDSQADSWGVTYWEHKEAGTAENCPQFAEYKDQGFGAVMAHEMRYDFATRTSLVSGKVNCEPAQ